jgi:hypothetical protein
VKKVKKKGSKKLIIKKVLKKLVATKEGIEGISSKNDKDELA